MAKNNHSFYAAVDFNDQKNIRSIHPQIYGMNYEKHNHPFYAHNSIHQHNYIIFKINSIHLKTYMTK